MDSNWLKLRAKKISIKSIDRHTSMKNISQHLVLLIFSRQPPKIDVICCLPNWLFNELDQYWFILDDQQRLFSFNRPNEKTKSRFENRLINQYRFFFFLFVLDDIKWRRRFKSKRSFPEYQSTFSAWNTMIVDPLQTTHCQPQQIDKTMETREILIVVQ